MPDINIKRNTFTPRLTTWTHSHSLTSPLLYPSVSTVLIRQSVINRFLISIFIFHIFVMQLIEINIETVGIFNYQLRQCVLFDTADQNKTPTKHIGCSYTKSYFNQFGEIPKSFPQQKSFSPTADICQTNLLSSASFVRLGNFSQGLLLPSSTGAAHGQLQKAPPGILANCNCSHNAMKYLDIFSHQLAQRAFPLFPIC